MEQFDNNCNKSCNSWYLMEGVLLYSIVDHKDKISPIIRPIKKETHSLQLTTQFFRKFKSAVTGIWYNYDCFFLFFFLFLFNVSVNNFSVMLRRSHLFLGITSTFGE